MTSEGYEKLIADGYIESGTLFVPVDDITKLELSHQEVKPTGAKEARQDKSVIVIDNMGRTKKVSSLLFGYNKHNVQLADGTFANADELLQAMQNAINNLDKGTIIVDHKGKHLNPEDLLVVAKEAAGKVTIGKKANIVNQDSRTWSIEGAHSDVEYKKGAVFGINGVDLKTGDYISVDEFLTALNNYVVMKPQELPHEPIPQEPQKVNQESMEPKVVRVVSKYKSNLRWLALVAALLVILSGFRMKNQYKTEIENVTNEYTQTEVTEALHYIAKEGITEKDINEAKQEFVSNLKIGDESLLKTGDILTSNSLGGNTLEIGPGVRKAGNYQISGVSIVQNGKMLAWHTDFSVANPGFEIGKFINEASAKHNLDLNQVEIVLHFGNSSNYTRTGWMNISKLINSNDIEQKLRSEAVTYEGVINNFNSGIITMETLNGPVNINVLDSMGNPLKPGTIVIGSDGKEYEVSGANIIENENINKVTNVSQTERQVVSGKKLTWSIKDCNVIVGLAPLLAAIAAEIATKKKNNEAEKNPTFLQFDNNQQYLDFKRSFEKAKEEYEKTSKFKKMLNNVFYHKKADYLQKLNDEQIKELYSTIRNIHNGTYSHNLNDKIEFKNGKIMVILSDDRKLDITDEVMPYIASIGKDNSVEAEGLLTDELLKEGEENGLQRR